jgi:lipoprotein-anchoring transpeptidase ErfK/SrfK
MGDAGVEVASAAYTSMRRQQQRVSTHRPPPPASVASYASRMAETHTAFGKKLPAALLEHAYTVYGSQMKGSSPRRRAGTPHWSGMTPPVRIGGPNRRVRTPASGGLAAYSVRPTPPPNMAARSARRVRPRSAWHTPVRCHAPPSTCELCPRTSQAAALASMVGGCDL